MKKGIIIGAIALLLVVLAFSSMYTVAENEYACTFRFSEIVNTQSEAGLHFKIPFIDSVRYFPKATQLYDIPPSPVLTSDKQNMTVDCYILWHIIDPQQFYRGLGTTAVAEDRLDAITYSALKRAMGTLAQADIINMNDGAERNDIYEIIAILPCRLLRSLCPRRRSSDCRPHRGGYPYVRKQVRLGYRRSLHR